MGTGFVGRDSELETLDGVLVLAHGGRGGLVIVSGDPGIGKTRLSLEACRRAEARGQRVAWGRAWEAGGAPSGWPVTEIVREIASEAALAKLGDKRAFLHPLVPDELVDAPPGPQSDDKSARFRTYEAVMLLVTAVAEETPLVLVFDDLHAADAMTTELVHFVARSTAARPVGIVVTWRPHEARLSAPSLDQLSAIAREATMIDLGPLSDDDAAEVVRRALGERGTEADDGALLSILEAGQGNPLFVEELARGSATGVRLPGGLEHAIRGHLSRLDEVARSVTEVAAVFGRRVDRAFLTEVCAAQLNISTAACADAVERAIENDVLTAEGPSVLSFVHILVRDALYESIAIGERRRRHATALNAMNARGTASAAELAFQALRAYPETPADQVLDLASRAAEEARRTYGFAEAAAIVSRAITTVAGDRSVETERLAEIELELARDEIMSGRVQAGKEIAQRVAVAADRRNPAPARVRDARRRLAAD